MTLTQRAYAVETIDERAALMLEVSAALAKDPADRDALQAAEILERVG